jgi:hypothetical protein
LYYPVGSKMNQLTDSNEQAIKRKQAMARIL